MMKKDISLSGILKKGIVVTGHTMSFGGVWKISSSERNPDENIQYIGNMMVPHRRMIMRYFIAVDIVFMNALLVSIIDKFPPHC